MVLITPDIHLPLSILQDCQVCPADTFDYICSCGLGVFFSSHKDCQEHHPNPTAWPPLYWELTFTLALV